MLSIIDSNGIERHLGNNSSEVDPLTCAVPSGFRVYGDVPETPMLKRDQWKPTSLSRFAPPIKDQNGVGACNAFGTVSAVEGARAVAGLTYVELWPGHLYGRINGGRDQGSLLEDALREIMGRGVPPRPADKSQYDWRSNYQGWEKDAAALGVAEECYWCPTFDHLASAVQCGFFLEVGIMWGNGDNPDIHGWLPESSRGGGGHAFVRDSLVYLAGRWGLDGANSWGNWGPKAGRMVVPENRFRSAIGGFFAIRSVRQGGDNPVPPLRP